MHGELPDLNSDTLKKLSISVLGQPLSKAYLDLKGGKWNDMYKHHIKKKKQYKKVLYFLLQVTQFYQQKVFQWGGRHFQTNNKYLIFNKYFVKFSPGDELRLFEMKIK